MFYPETSSEQMQLSFLSSAVLHHLVQAYITGLTLPGIEWSFPVKCRSERL